MNALADKKCVILGGGGFLGTNLCLHLTDKVKALRIFGHPPRFPKELAKVEYIPGVFENTDNLHDVLAGYDTVVHLISAMTPASANADMVGDVQTSLIPTLKLLEACRLAKIKKIIFISSGGTIYGIPKSLPIPEDANTTPLTAYAISKLAIEKYLALYEYLYGLEYRILRPSNPYGPFQLAVKHQGVIAAFLNKALSEKSIEIWGDGSIIRDYIYVDDIVAAVEKAVLHTGSGRFFNIGSGQGRSVHDVIVAIEHELERKITTRWLQGRPVDVPANILDIKFSKEELDWQPQTSFERGIAQTTAWMRAQLK